MAYFTALVTLVLSEMVAAIGSSYKSFACTRDFHVADLMVIEIGGGMLIGLIGVTVGMLISNAGGASGCGGMMCFPFYGDQHFPQLIFIIRILFCCCCDIIRLSIP